MRTLPSSIPFLLAVLLLSACSQDWSAQSDEDGGHSAESGTQDAQVESSTQLDAEGAEASTPCSDEMCGPGTCNAAGNCDCNAGHRFDGERCQPDACTSQDGAPVCGSNEQCLDDTGSARCACTAGYERCGSVCVDAQRDPAHCGGCGIKCAGDLSCESGSCQQKVRKLVLAKNTSCALLESATGAYPLRCWGSGDHDLYRDGSSNALTPRAISGLVGGRDFALAGTHRCLLSASADSLQCWGRCGANCGLAEVAPSAEALHTLSTPGVTQISAAAGLFNDPVTCYLNAAQGLVCFGYKVLVTDSTYDRRHGITISIGAPLTSSKVRSMSGNESSMCALTEDRRVATWGYNNLGQLGNGLGNNAPTTNYALYVPADGGGELSDVVTAQQGLAMGCAVRSNGDLYCWGGYVLGKTGALKIEGAPADIVDIAMGMGFTLLRTKDQRVYGWGSRVGLGLGADAKGDGANGETFSTPIENPELRGALEIAAGAGHACARMISGQVLCWGDNTQGQLGDGTQIQRLSPVAVQGLP